MVNTLGGDNKVQVVNVHEYVSNAQKHHALVRTLPDGL